jgi:PilX N-terminal
MRHPVLVRQRHSAISERGAALIITLLMVALIAAIAAALIVTTTTETLISGSHRAAHEAFYAADAALERAIAALAAITDWSPIVAAAPGNLVAGFSDGQARPIAPDGRALDLAALTALRQAASDTVYAPSVYGADSPRWQLFAHTRLQDLIPEGTLSPPAYLLIWVADDAADGDGDVHRDANARVLVHAEAYGPGGARRAVEAAVARTPEGAVRVLAWKEIRSDAR